MPDRLIAVFETVRDARTELTNEIEEPFDGVMLDQCLGDVRDVVTFAQNVDDRQNVVLFPPLAFGHPGAHGRSLRDRDERRLIDRKIVDDVRGGSAV